MPWESRTVEDQRREFAQAAMYCKNFKNGQTVTEIASH